MDNECSKCYGKGWYPVWEEDPDDDFVGGFEAGEAYCSCEKGVSLAVKEITYSLANDLKHNFTGKPYYKEGLVSSVNNFLNTLKNKGKL